MKINLKKDFNNTPFTIGIEEEYMICDPVSGDMVDRADKIIASNRDIKNKIGLKDDLFFILYCFIKLFFFTFLYNKLAKSMYFII